MSTIREQMARYLDLHKEETETLQTIQSLKQKLTYQQEEKETLQKSLNNSVQPRCGSATKPSRRIWTDGHYTTLIVEWDDKFSRPIISVQEREE